MPQDDRPPAPSAQAFIDQGRPSFAPATGPCIRCGSDDDVAKVRGANLCAPCLRGGSSPRYDLGARRSAKDEKVAEVRANRGAAQKVAREVNEERRRPEYEAAEKRRAEASKRRPAAHERPSRGRAKVSRAGGNGG